MTPKEQAARNKRKMAALEREIRRKLKSLLNPEITPENLTAGLNSYNPDLVIDFRAFEAQVFNTLVQSIGNSALNSANGVIDTIPRPGRDSLIWSQFGGISTIISAKAAEQTSQISDGTRMALLLVMFSGLPELAKRKLAASIAGLSAPGAQAVVSRYNEEYQDGRSFGLDEYRASEYAQDAANSQAEKHRDWRAEIIGISAITAGFAMGARDVLLNATLSGALSRSTRMFWEDAGDGKVRASHQNVAPVAVGEMFVLGSGVVTEGPGLSGVPSEDCQCRCSIAYEE